MLDVHAPHERIHGFRDFLLHLLTITIGLLIALGLEGCVEWSHHRHLRQEADRKIHQEIRDNKKEVALATGAIARERQNFTAVLQLFQARSRGESPMVHQLSLNYDLAALSNASWQTASATGALGYMEYGHVQQYATAYQLQDQFVAAQAAVLNATLQVGADLAGNFDPMKVTPSEAQVAGADARRVLSNLVALEQFGTALEKSYDEALKAE